MRLTDHRKKLRQNPEFLAAEKELKPFLVLADNVLRFRLEKGWSQSELAERVGTKQSNISRLEDGISNPTLRFIVKLSEALNVNISELMKERGNKYQFEAPETVIYCATFKYCQPELLHVCNFDVINPAFHYLRKVYLEKVPVERIPA